MIWKKILALGLISTFVSSISCLVYAKIYTEAFYVHFEKIISATNIVSASALGCFLMSIGYMFSLQWKGEQSLKWLNIIYGVLSFASIIGVFQFSLPLDIESPEMFAGMAIPMHFFPILSILTVYPFFNRTLSFHS